MKKLQSYDHHAIKLEFHKGIDKQAVVILKKANEHIKMNK